MDMTTKKIRLTAPERKAMIIDVATELFAENGFHGVSIDDIVNTIGVSPAILYRHFESKEALYKAVFDHANAQREVYKETVPIVDGSLQEILRAMSKVFVRNITQHPSILKIELHSLLDGIGTNRPSLNDRWKIFPVFIEFMIEELSEENGVAGVNPRVAGLMFQGMIREVLLAKCMDDTDPLSDMDTDHLIDQLITLFLAALGAPSEK
ncbi:MAG TPA: TetR/AcrR family transcriptional regulator [Rhodospirillales bacterium]|nr:TetR/AcrR family transcriptional regulator [Rhodospirillales bacterium]